MARKLPSVKKLTIPKSTGSASSENTAPVNETEEETGASSTKHYGDYYMVPSMATLKRMSYSQLAAISNFTVGQHGIGQVRFLKPVDLTGIDLDAILDHLIVFGANQVVVYPEDDFPERPPVGQGLNQPAEVRLERCWPTARSTRDPITEMGGERMRRHIERIKTVEGTHFVDFFPETGTWVFTVDHF
jgi:nuclear pore complex protein Nup98-Nup96